MTITQGDPISNGTTGINYLNRNHLLQPGDRVEQCRVIDLIAAGGMANVYKVWHEQLEVVRAIKILKPGYTEENKGRLETEAKISANLRHKNIVEIYGMGYWNEIPYIEMEYVDGPSLKELLESHVRLSIPLSLAITHYLCVALRFAYNQDMTLYGKVYDRLIHRDLKPANILISSKGVVKLADFGIARPSEVSIHTVGAKVMGTFAYLSPEQLNGEKLDQRSDIYTLGAVLYEMISGVKTFPQKLLGDLVQKKAKGYYVPIGSMGIPIHKSIIDIIEKCLYLDKNKRYPDIIDVNEAISSVLSRISSKSPSALVKSMASDDYDKSKKTSVLRSNALWISILLIIIVTGFVSLFFITRNIKETTPPKITNVTTVDTTASKLPKRDSLPDKPIADKMPKQLSSPLTKKLEITPSETPLDKGLSAFRSGNYGEAIAQLSMVPADNRDPAASLKISITQIESYIKMRQYDRALSIAEEEAFESPDYYYLLGILYHHFEKLDQASKVLLKALTFDNIDSSILFRIRLLKCQLSEKLYELKPNVNNKKIVSDDLTAFIDCCCINNSQLPSCKEARAKIEQLSF